VSQKYTQEYFAIKSQKKVLKT